MFSVRSGCYQIRCVEDGDRYVGGTFDMLRRWREHRGYLEINRHQNQKLQAAWNKHGADKFVFEVLEFIPLLTDKVATDKAIRAAETQYFAALKPAYNKARVAHPCVSAKPRPTKPRIVCKPGPSLFTGRWKRPPPTHVMLEAGR